VRGIAVLAAYPCGQREHAAQSHARKEDHLPTIFPGCGSLPVRHCPWETPMLSFLHFTSDGSERSSMPRTWAFTHRKTVEMAKARVLLRFRVLRSIAS
jgi:hypothetical protein